jgi:sulfonate transport system permease protein
MGHPNRIGAAFHPRALLLPAVLLASWVAWTHFHKSLLFPSPQDSLRVIGRLWHEGALQHYLATSLRRFIIGFASGAAAGFLLGALLGSSRWLERFLLPNLHGFRQVPIVGWIPLLILWFGLGDPARIIIIAMGAFFPMLLNTHAGFRNVSVRYREVGRVFGLGRFALLRRIVLPAALPWIRTGSILSLTFAWTLLVASEILTETNGGLSDILDVGRETFHLEMVNAGILLLGAIGFLLNAAVVRFWSLGRLRLLAADARNRDT